MSENTTATATVSKSVRAARMAATFAEGDFLPRKLLCNHTWLHQEADRLTKAGYPALAECIPLVRIQLPTGGIEHRPVARFDKLPTNWSENVWIADLSRSKPIYRPVVLDNFDPEMTDPVDVGIAILVALSAGKAQQRAPKASQAPQAPQVELLGWRAPEATQEPQEPMVPQLGYRPTINLQQPQALADAVRQALDEMSVEPAVEPTVKPRKASKPRKGAKGS